MNSALSGDWTASRRFGTLLYLAEQRKLQPHHLSNLFKCLLSLDACLPATEAQDITDTNVFIGLSIECRFKIRVLRIEHRLPHRHLVTQTPDHIGRNLEVGTILFSSEDDFGSEHQHIHDLGQHHCAPEGIKGQLRRDYPFHKPVYQSWQVVKLWNLRPKKQRNRLGSNPFAVIHL